MEFITPRKYFKEKSKMMQRASDYGVSSPNQYIYNAHSCTQGSKLTAGEGQEDCMSQRNKKFL